MLAGAALLVTAGILNFAQRLRHETPAWDGISWTDTKQGIIADTVAARFLWRARADSCPAID